MTGSVICGAHESPTPPAPSLIDDGPDALSFLRDAIAAYLLELHRQGFSPATAKTYGHPLASFVGFLRERGSPPTCLADLTSEVVLGFRDHEISREKRWKGSGPLSARSVQIAIKALRGFFRHLIRRGDLLLDPTLDLKGPRVPRTLPRNIPTSRQMRKLLKTPDVSTAVGKRDRAILELLYGTGLRNAELCGLARGDVDLDGRTVYVRHGKGDKERLVPMGKKAVEAVTAYLAVYGELAAGRPAGLEPPLFLTTAGTPVAGHILKKQLRKYVSAARLDQKTTPHSLRHACATHLLRGGADIRQIQSLLGHASLEATQIYTRVETSDLRKMLDHHHPRGGRLDADES